MKRKVFSFVLAAVIATHPFFPVSAEDLIDSGTLIPEEYTEEEEEGSGELENTEQEEVNIDEIYSEESEVSETLLPIDQESESLFTDYSDDGEILIDGDASVLEEEVQISNEMEDMTTDLEEAEAAWNGGEPSVPEDSEINDMELIEETPVQPDEPEDNLDIKENQEEGELEQVGASSGTYINNIKWKYNNGILEISGTGRMKVYNSADYPWEKFNNEVKQIIIHPGVESIANYAFSNFEYVEKVTFPDSLKEFNTGAFSNCYMLNNVTIPDSVTKIGDSAFEHCKLTHLVIPDNVYYVGIDAFKGCSSEDIVIGSGLVYLGSKISSYEDYPFYDCYKLKKITVNPNNKYFSSQDGVLFNKDKTNLIKYPAKKTGKYTVPNSVKTISPEAFNYNREIKSVIIPGNVEEIGLSAFGACHFLEDVTISNGVEYIGSCAFEACGSLKKIVIPDSVMIIDSGAFWYCHKLESIQIGNKTEVIGKEAFEDCNQLKIIKFTGKAPKLEEDAFYNITTTAYYPAYDSTWTEDKMQNYGGNITWKPYYNGLQGKQPKLIGAYNGAKGIGIKFYKVDGAKEYVFYRKENGKWKAIATVGANDSSLQVSGNTVMYTDITVANNYGKGYVYSVAAKSGNVTTPYDTLGKAIYRLKPPVLTKGTNSSSGTAVLTWNSMFSKTELNGNYDLQFAEYVNGKAGTFKSVITRPGYDNKTTSARVSGLKKGKTYAFRIRCSKTNKDRGTFYSAYSPWLNVKITK